MKVGIVGCGAIGSRIARSISNELKNTCSLSGVFDKDLRKANLLAMELNTVHQADLDRLIKQSDCIVEAVDAPSIRTIIQKALWARKNVLVMSTGKLLRSLDLIRLAKKKNVALLIPSGAVAGIDAIKAAGSVPIKKLTLTTRKPISGFANNTYLAKKGIRLDKIKGEKTLFEGSVQQAVKQFPQNINVAVTVALAAKAMAKLKIRIITSPQYTKNSHEIEMISAAGRIFCQTENVVCPDNPKTSYLAVLSAIQALKQFSERSFIGT